MYNTKKLTAASSPLLPYRQNPLYASAPRRSERYEESKSSLLTKNYAMNEPKGNNDERINYFLKLMEEIHKTRDEYLSHYLFHQFEFTKV